MNNETNNIIKIIFSIAIAIPLCFNGLFWGWDKWIGFDADSKVKIIEAETKLELQNVENCLKQENTYWNGGYCEYKKPDIR